MQKQENNILPEYQTLPPDSIAPEYPPLPDEYLQSKQPVEKGVPERSESRKRKAMRILCMLTACVLLGCSVYELRQIRRKYRHRQRRRYRHPMKTERIGTAGKMTMYSP